MNQAVADKASSYIKALHALKDDDRLRSLKPRTGIDFSSNDYLGLASAPRMRSAVSAALEAGTPIGAGGSRLLRGNCEEHEALEAEAAGFFGTEAALFFGGGYVANFAVLTTLPQRGDLLVLDALVHASVHEGARAGRAERREVAHNDAGAVESAIVAWRAAGGRGRVWIVVESLYSMDGDFAPLAELVGIAGPARRLSDRRRGPCHGRLWAAGTWARRRLEGRDNVVAVHTCGKALGVAGALVTGAARPARLHVNRCRPFIFSTAPSPLTAVAVQEALAILPQEPERRQRLPNLVASAHREIGARRGSRVVRLAQILPVVVGDNGGRWRWRQRCRHAASTFAGCGRRPCRKARRGCAFP